MGSLNLQLMRKDYEYIYGKGLDTYRAHKVYVIHTYIWIMLMMIHSAAQVRKHQ